jgi:hypothetical protein
MANATDPNFRYIPEWFLGPDLTQIGVWPIQRQTDGTWNTLPGTLALAGSIDRIELIEEITHQVIKPVNRRQRNEVIVEDGWSLNIVEIQKTDPKCSTCSPDGFLQSVRYLSSRRGWSSTPAGSGAVRCERV